MGHLHEKKNLYKKLGVKEGGGCFLKGGVLSEVSSHFVNSHFVNSVQGMHQIVV